MDLATRILIHTHCHGGSISTPRGVLADRLQEVGRHIEEQLVRATALDLTHICGVLVPVPTPDEHLENPVQRSTFTCTAMSMELMLVELNAALKFVPTTGTLCNWHEELQEIAKVMHSFHQLWRGRMGPCHFASMRMHYNVVFAAWTRLRSDLPINFDLYHCCTF